MRKHVSSAFVLSALVLVFGCGGGGAGGDGRHSLPAAYETAQVSTYLGRMAPSRAQRRDSSDWASLSDAQHVVVTIRKVVLMGRHNTPDATIYDDPAGKTVDLATLGGGGTASLLNVDTAPSGLYAGVSVYIDKKIAVTLPGDTTSHEWSYQSLFGDTSPYAVVAWSWAENPNGVVFPDEWFGGQERMTILFDLSNWSRTLQTMDGETKILAQSGANLEFADASDESASSESVEGVVSNVQVNGKVATFTFVSDPNNEIPVYTDSQTVGSDALANLRNGDEVWVRGLYHGTSMRASKLYRFVPSSSTTGLPGGDTGSDAGSTIAGATATGTTTGTTGSTTSLVVP